jgi:hypothetical protein
VTQPTAQGTQLTAGQMAALLALVQTQAKNRQQMMQSAAAGAVAVLRGFTDWWDADAINKMIADVLRVVTPLQRQAVTATDAYLTNASSIISGQRMRPAGAADIRFLRRAMTEQLADEILSGARRTAWVELGNPGDGPGEHIDTQTGFGLEHDREYQTAEDAYGKIADNFRFNTVVRGDEPLRAQQKAEARIAAVAQTDVTLAVREQYRRNLGNQGATGYRRILHPELSQTGPCGLCVVAADRVYRTEDLLPLHNRCVCEVLPVYGRTDPGVTLNGDDLRRIYDAAGGNTREALRRVRVVLTEHGELGPILVHGEQHYRGPEEVARNYASNRRVREQAILDGLYGIHEMTQIRTQRGDELPKSLRWQRERIDELERSLRR